MHRPSGVPSCTRLCSALSAALSAGSSGSELMKSGSDSSEASCSSNEGGCGPIAMLLSSRANQSRNGSCTINGFGFL